MARDLLLENGDLPLRNELVGGAVDIRQRIALRLRRYAGEWFLDLDVGIPYLDWAQQKPLDEGIVVARLRTEIESVDGVASTRNFTAERPTPRSLTVTGDVQLDDGTVEQVTVASPDRAQTNGAPWGVFFGGA